MTFCLVFVYFMLLRSHKGMEIAQFLYFPQRDATRKHSVVEQNILGGGQTHFWRTNIYTKKYSENCRFVISALQAVSSWTTLQGLIQISEI